MNQWLQERKTAKTCSTASILTNCNCNCKHSLESHCNPFASSPPKGTLFRRIWINVNWQLLSSLSPSSRQKQVPRMIHFLSPPLTCTNGKVYLQHTTHAKQQHFTRINGYSRITIDIGHESVDLHARLAIHF